MRHAPILSVDSVFDAELCRDLIAAFGVTGGETFSDVLTLDNKPVLPSDPELKQRSDVTFTDQTHPALVQRCRAALEARLLPMILQAFAFNVTQIERYLVGRYDAESKGHFGPHRDNVVPYAAHRKFALSLGLNEDYEGGTLRFPEWGSEYRLRAGEAIVFSCSLLHEATVVTKGKRYAFLTFFYDDEGARLRYLVAMQIHMLTAQKAAS
jgi:predicted 2-oxoglutarate/Fe(II)-dependent dioxygenase YbiX